ncbi:RdgB/HAM1 family non-canonical purine NTP pyrophosphatase [Rubrolithibacter danxiaensis]|uniref:RdgB/HAM1 family non-canonical purine NTP pyrophosphatase n=1 Tax=Rubrolithibacter danxiaensis TaxID=3390805 RepID=UPI003BF8D0CF
MFKTLVFASNNLHKLEEVQLLVGTEFQLRSLNDIGCFDDIPETGATFEENALLKSCYVYDRYKIDCFADDSGLEVEALNNEPGVFSARYSGTRDSEQNLLLVLQKLKGIDNRRASFRSVISLILNGEKHLFEGVVRGHIRHELSGVKGFGYDPIFQPEDYSVTFAEMDIDQKNAISHRGIAIKKMVSFLLQQ